ncbi:hypothetical protein B0J13DRAFT_620266 [Dactylonectria estremocensis]|uniref:Uncharacterized protein n=1 Tax=Dactylonectria estremocensis TaxID=1079267 RepID=A0A9P9F198_9HYPO|nr:hypothetical protein B0J13DRAFT_620266 [Dactylonectria estremocensis]
MTSSDPSYAPVVSSPLNPLAPRAGRRRRSRSVRRGPASHTLAQRLLRSKAAEAWREHVVSSQFVQGDNIGVVRRKVSRSRGCCPSLPDLKSLGLSFSLVGYTDSQQPVVQFRLPDLSCLTTRRVMMALGLAGTLPALAAPNLLRRAEPL